MENFYIKTNNIKNSIKNLLNVGEEINNIANTVSRIAENTGSIDLGNVNDTILAQLLSIEKKIEKNSKKTQSLAEALDNIVKKYISTEEKILSTSVYTVFNLSEVTRTSPSANVDNTNCSNAEEEFFDNIKIQYGFDERTISIMKNVYDNIKEEYSDESQEFIDWKFFRALSQLGGYDDDDYNGPKDAANIWKQGAGNAYGETKHENFYTNTLGLSEDDYNYLKYNLRMQHNVSSSPDSFNTTCIDELSDKKKEKWRTNMETGLGEDGLTDKQMQSNINEMYNMYNGKGDFTHMCYTLSGNLNDDWGGVDNKWRSKHVEGWGSSDTRKDIIGWLGDATITVGDDKGPSFGVDDYISDLDADNIYNRIDYSNGITAMDAMNNYYNEMSDSNNYNEFRGNEFLQNNPYEDVEKAILNKLGYDSYEELKQNDSYSDTVDFLDELNRLNINQQVTDIYLCLK